VGLFGAYQALIFDVFTFILSGLLLSFLPNIPQGYRVKNDDIEAKKSIRELLLYQKELLILFGVRLFTAIVVIATDILLVIYIRDILHQKEFFFGIIVTMLGLGNMTGAFYIFKRKSKQNPWRDLKTALVFTATLPFTFGICARIDGSSFYVLSIILLSAYSCGIGSAIAIIQTESLLQITCPKEMVGRASGLMQSTITGGFIIGFILVPLLVPKFVSIGDFFLISCGVLLGIMLCLKSSFLTPNSNMSTSR
jgi:MFS transporter, DHA3 family, macrolide efflux protein